MRPEIVLLLAKHGGVRAVHTIGSLICPNSGRTMAKNRMATSEALVVRYGSHCVAECMDGVLIQLDKDEARTIAEDLHYQFLQQVRMEWERGR